MDTLFVSKDAKLTRKDNTLLVQNASGPKIKIPITPLKHIIIAGEAGLTTSLLSLLGKNGTRVTILDWYGHVSGHFEPLNQPRAGIIRLSQAKHVQDLTSRLKISRKIILAAHSNIQFNLKGSLQNPLNEEEKTHFAAYKNKIADATSIPEIMGHEGNMRRVYYSMWGRIHPNLDFGPRKRRPPNNRINCLISWYNGLLYGLCRQQIAQTHLDETLSFLHSPLESRSSLSLDIAEVFKPAICDTLIFESIRRAEALDNWFHEDTKGVCRLSETGRRQSLEKWISKTEERRFEGMSYKEIIRNEGLAL